MRRSLYSIVIWFIFCVIIQMTSCDVKSTYKIPEGKTEYSITEYTYEEIYNYDEFIDEISSPICKRVLTYPTNDCMYSLYTNWYRSYKNDDGEIESYLLCQDPLCDHSKLTCISYATLSSTDIVEANGKLYFLIQGTKFIEYDLTIDKYEILFEFENGGELLTRLGRFIYFYIFRVDGQTESGKVISTKLLQRYDIVTSKLEKIGESSQDKEYIYSTGKNGYIYYIDSYRKLNRCDENMKNNETINTSEKIGVYVIDSEILYYLTKEYGDDYGTLYLHDLNTNESKKIYEKLTWFCVDGEKLYYSKYEPIDAFEWDYPISDLNDVNKTTRQMITIMNGNKIYSINISDAGEKEGKVLTSLDQLAENGYYLGEVYTVYDGYVYTHIKESYSEGNRKGLITGTTAISLETGDVYLIATDYTLYS